ncbi:MAG: hypothetical protein DMD94_14620 [Candidatus Rokuibacteriota bacterium]|nr:MAG: hypothetical protein DMD94_14620 [Candidatus Rokubacteria bacterium]
MRSGGRRRNEVRPSLKEIADRAAAEAERQAICLALRATRGNKSEAARLIPLAAAPDFLGAAAVPVPRGPSLFLRAADGGFTRSHLHLFRLPKAPRFARVRSQAQSPEERSHAGTRFAESVGSDER